MSFRFLNDSSGGFQGEQVVTPSETFIDPVSKIRVSNPSNLIDTDFEYGLQPTKWETVELINNTPAFFSKGGDTTIPDIVSITTNAGTREITVETAFAHALDPGIPIRVSGTRSVTADGSYIINATPSMTTFTYLARANQPETISIFDLYTSIITGEFFQGSQISIADAEGITTDGAGPASDLLVRTTTKHGFGNNTPFYFLNLNSTVSQEFESQNSTSVSFDPTNAATALSFDGSNTLLQTPIDLSNSATTSIFQSTITGVNLNENTITVSLASGEDWSNLRLGDPLYYSVTVASGFFNQNPRGVVFIKDVSGVDQANGTATFQVSELPDGDPINITSNITGFFQIADQARTFAGNNIDDNSQIEIDLEFGDEKFFDGNNDGFVDENETIFNVTNDGSGAYLINGDSNPTLNLQRGVTYTFNIDASGHPFWIQSVPAPYDANNIYNTGVTNNGTDNGIITFQVASNAPDDLYYVCQFHPAMTGSISVSDGLGTEGTVIGYAGSSITLGSGTQTLDFYEGAMLQYSTTDGSPNELTDGATYFVTSFNPSQTPGLFTMTIAELPGGNAINFTSTGSGTQTFNRIGVSIDKNIWHVRNHGFVKNDMLLYKYPLNGDVGREDFVSSYMFVDDVLDPNNIRLKEEFSSINYFGTGQDGDVVIASNTQLQVENTNPNRDGDMVVRNYESLTINSGATLTTSQPCRGLLIYVRGDCVINGSLSMSGRGAFANPLIAGASDQNPVDPAGLRFPFITETGNQFLEASPSLLNGCGLNARNSISNHSSINGNGTILTIPREGSAPAAAVPSGTGYARNFASNGVNGQTGGGGGGGRSTGGMYAGVQRGGLASCFSGGAGSGGSAHAGSVQGASPGEQGEDWGGRGGRGSGYTGTSDGNGHTAGGGAGNPGGGGSGVTGGSNGFGVGFARPVGNTGATGNGGLIVLIVGGNLTVNGSIVANGSPGGNKSRGEDGSGGGGSGGGSINIVYAEGFLNNGNIQALGGAGGSGNAPGSPGGNGSVQTLQVLR